MRLILASCVLLISCAHITPVEHQLLDCGSAAVKSQLPGLVSEVSGIMNSGQLNWMSALDSVLSVAGPAAICAVKVVVSDLEHASARTGVSEVALVRGESWLATDSHYKLTNN